VAAGGENETRVQTKNYNKIAENRIRKSADKKYVF